MALESVNICPICSGTSFQLYERCKDFTTSKEEFTIFKCESCDFLMTSPRPDNHSIKDYYLSENYISHTNSSKNLIDKLYKLIRSFTLRWKLRIIENKKSAGYILDYGCGTGEFLNTCKKAGWSCSGVEPSEAARKKAELLTNQNIFENLNQLDQIKFDIITLWHVLEHIHNLNEIISILKGYLAEDGLLFVAVPNHKSLDATLYKSNWAGYDLPRHLWHFSKETLKKLLNQNGLTIKEILPMKQDSYYVSLLSEKYQHPKSNILTNLFKSIFIGFQSNLVAKKNQNYSSLVYIAKSCKSL